VHPLLLASPFFARGAFDDLRRQLRHPAVPYGRAAVAHRSVDETADTLGEGGPAYRRLMAPLVRQAGPITAGVLGPLRSVPDHPVALARFGLPGFRLVRRWEGDAAPALLAGVAAHSMAPLDAPLTSAFGLLLATTAHAVGWPVVAGGSSAITEAMVSELERLGGHVTTSQWVSDLADLPPSTVAVLDTAPTGLLQMAGSRLPDRYRRSLRRFRYGPGVCKVDWALSGPVPWRSEACRKAGTLHLGGTLAEVARSEADANAGRHAERPYCIVVQPGVADPTRAPDGAHTLLGYCHVPAGSTVDMTAAIEAQIERFAPGFSDLVVARSVRTAAEEERANPNYVGGDIGGGAATFGQTLFRPTVQWNPYRTPLGNVYLCSASTPPGGGVSGLYAARSVLHDHFGGPRPFLSVR
jgi:phytoene dehydrogenase-like protein